MYQQRLQKQALGRLAHLGDLYDERTDSFLGFSILKSELNHEALKSSDSPFTGVELALCASTSEKFAYLGVEEQLKLSVMCGLCPLLDGSAK